ncbi:MAG: thiol:disulfide interchange protein, partial [Fibrobacter sp.]|nr:thiol:disulfide interchange protein [Fibrobacter sp.]
MNNMPPPEVGMRYSAGTLQKGSNVIVDIVIPDNWHVNANIAADEFLKPSSIEISAKGVHFGEPKWPEPIKEYSEALDLENLVFKGYFQITLPVEGVDSEYDSLTTQATFHYQACDNSICLAPSQVTFGLGALGFNKKSTMQPGLKKNDDENGSLENAPLNGSANDSPMEGGFAGTLALLLSALFGGLILNLMPCVLPV